jgi:hypothetical protein
MPSKYDTRTRVTSPIGENRACCQMLRSVDAIRKFARQTLATVRGDFLDALKSTASARESITCYADSIVPRLWLADPKAGVQPQDPR